MFAMRIAEKSGKRLRALARVGSEDEAAFSRNLGSFFRSDGAFSATDGLLSALDNPLSVTGKVISSRTIPCPSRSFTNALDHALEETAGAVRDNLYGNAAFPTPPVIQPALQAALTAFTAAIAGQMQGGSAATADKNNKGDILVNLLRQLAGYVQATAANDLAVLLGSGFEAVSASRASQPLDPPSIRDVLNGNTGQIIVRVTPIANAAPTKPATQWPPLAASRGRGKAASSSQTPAPSPSTASPPAPTITYKSAPSATVIGATPSAT